MMVHTSVSDHRTAADCIFLFDDYILLLDELKLAQPVHNDIMTIWHWHCHHCQWYAENNLANNILSLMVLWWSFFPIDGWCRGGWHIEGITTDGLELVILHFTLKTFTEQWVRTQKHIVLLCTLYAKLYTDGKVSRKPWLKEARVQGNKKQSLSLLWIESAFGPGLWQAGSALQCFKRKRCKWLRKREMCADALLL